MGNAFRRESVSQGPQTTSSVVQVDKRVGVEGSGNVILGDNGQFSYSSKDTNTSTSQDIKGDGNFAPVFNFTGRTSVKQRATAPLNLKAYRT